MAITHVATISAALGPNGGTTSALNTTGATLLVAAISRQNSASHTFTDSKGNTWTPLTPRDPLTGPALITYYSVPIAVGTGHTFTVSGTGIYASLIVQAFASTPVFPFDSQAGTAVGGSSTSASTSVSAPSQNGALLLTSVCLGTTATAITASSPAGQTQTTVNGAGGVNYGLATGYMVQATATGVTATYTWTTTSGAGLEAVWFLPVAVAGAEHAYTFVGLSG